MAGRDPGRARGRRPLTPELDEYRRKRDLGATPEPTPGPRGAKGGAGFVIQRHDARSLHFDLRLEIDGVLASWAVPKGVPLREGVRRMAVRTEDHPLEYLDFAGVIPEGQYGAGRMTIWDRGAYETELFGEDEIKVVLHGEVIDGHYHLVRTARGGAGRDWLVFRARAGADGPPDPRAAFASLRPMLASSAPEPFDDDAWSFELKWDGYRALALIDGDGAQLRSRNGNDLSASLPGLGGLRRAIFAQEAVIDAELVVLDADGRADFQALQRGEGTAVLMAFDLLQVDGRSLLDEHLDARRARLREILTPEAAGTVVLSDEVHGSGVALFAAALERGLEGIVAKRRDSPYRPGRRSEDWIKIKARREGRFLIAGWIPGSGGRRNAVASLVVAERQGDELVMRGQVGSGIDAETERTLRERLRPLATDEPTVPGEVTGEVQWVRPELSCDVVYAEVTADGRLRAPVWRGFPDTDQEPRRPTPNPVFGASGDEQVLRDGDREITLTNLRKTFWEREALTKGDLLAHYARLAPVLVPHLEGRPLILKRYPDGADAAPFFQHNVPDNAPPWLATAELARSDKEDASPNRYAIVDDPLSLLWVVNLGAIDLNPWQSRAETPDCPTHVLFDLDPMDGLPFARVVETALAVAELLDSVGLRGYPKTTGGSGMHIFVPITPGPTYATTRLFAQAAGEILVRRHPSLVTTEVRKAARGARVYLDANQNGRGRSISSVYSVRPRRGAPVATPLRWDEVEPGLDPGDGTMATVAARISEHGDLFAPVLSDLQDLAPAVERLADL